ncbi:MAG: hypothetical protein OMOMHJEC_02763 [Xanthomonadales bacterium]|nr:hypothetical protein [Xanthomonadales bacterium]
MASGLGHPCLGGHALLGEFPHHARRRSVLAISAEEIAHQRGLGLVDHELALDHVIAKRRHAAHPHALGLAGGDLVPDALAGDLALELREGEQDVQGQASHRRCGVELLSHRHERHVVAVEHIDEPGEVRERAGQSVDLVDDHDVDALGLDVGEQAAQARALHVAAREATIVVAIVQRHPAFVALAGDERQAGIALGFEAVVLLVESLVAGFAGVDRTAFLGDDRRRRRVGSALRLHARSFVVSPKKAGPDQRVPAMWQAMAVRLV